MVKFWILNLKTKPNILWNHLVRKCSFRHNLTGAHKKKTYLTNVVKESVLMKEMPYRPLNMESFGHKIIILSQPVPLTGTGVLYPRVREFFWSNLNNSPYNSRHISLHNCLHTSLHTNLNNCHTVCYDVESKIWPKSIKNWMRYEHLNKLRY